MSLIQFIDNLKTPHKNYYPIIKYFTSIYGNNSIVKMCHITGGGLSENLRRVVPLKLRIEYNNVKLKKIYPDWCKVIEDVSETSREEMYRVFNCGIGFVIIVSPEMKQKIENDKIFSFDEIAVIN